MATAAASPPMVSVFAGAAAGDVVDVDAGRLSSFLLVFEVPPPSSTSSWSWFSSSPAAVVVVVVAAAAAMMLLMSFPSSGEIITRIPSSSTDGTDASMVVW